MGSEIGNRRMRLRRRKKDPRWNKLVTEYSELCESQGKKIDVDWLSRVKVDILEIIVEAMQCTDG